MKHASRLFSLLVLTAAFVLLTGSICQKSAPERAWERGAFEPMPKNTQPYTLPNGVSVDSLFGYEDDTDSLSSDTPLYLVVSSTNSSDTKVTFPAGLLFNPDNAVDYEYMMLVQEFSFTVPSNGTKAETLPTYGCNEDSLDIPDADAYYSIGDKEWDKETQELFDLLTGKTIQGDDAKELVQQALNEITGPEPDYNGLTDSTKTALQNLP